VFTNFYCLLLYASYLLFSLCFLLLELSPQDSLLSTTERRFALCALRLAAPPSVSICVNLRLIIPKSLLLVLGPYCSVLSTRCSVLTLALRSALSALLPSAYCLLLPASWRLAPCLAPTSCLTQHRKYSTQVQLF